MMTDYRVLSARDNPLQYLSGFSAIYRQAFSPAPYAKSELEISIFTRSFPGHVQRADFRMVLAEQSGEIIGFAYGYTTAADHYWNEFVRGYLLQVETDAWLSYAFQLVEIALIPAHQGQGIGGSLYDRLMEGLPHHTAVLTTMCADTNAYNLYKRRGWITLVEEQHPPGMNRAYRTMGLKLK